MLILAFALLNPELPEKPEIPPVLSSYEDACRDLRHHINTYGAKRLGAEFWSHVTAYRCTGFPKPPPPTDLRPATRIYTRLTTRIAPNPSRNPRALPTLGTQRIVLWKTEAAGPPEPEVKEETTTDVENNVIVVEGKKRFDCPSPAIGWLGVTDNRADDPAQRRINFDGTPPELRSGDWKRVPQFNELIRFSPEHPASIFESLLPCFLDDGGECDKKLISGTFQVVGRLSDTAGPRGQMRWQLCVVPVEGPRS